MPPVNPTNDHIFTQRALPQFSKAIKSTSSSLDYLALSIIIGTLSVTSVGIWWLSRRYRDAGHTSSTEYLILESTVSIEIGEGAIEIEYEDEDIEGRISLDTISYYAPPQRIAFEIDKLPTLHIEPKSGNILERRGRKTLKLQPPKGGEADMALVNIKGGRLTVSPFSSKREPAKLLTDFPATRRRASKASVLNSGPPSGIATAPYMLQSSWRPLEDAASPAQR